ncbi:MAG: DinB family protein [Fimbriimonadaceae bacterium]|nr:DinB family protein [Fimbriimonadaceae bacterium]QYK55518.1 MAG: DinB family protein [Fimbriimonadaceae bacterium]
MTAADILVRQLERQQESFLKMVHRVPKDKLDWSPSEGVRSVLDQFQEVATIVGDHWEIYSDRKMDWDEEKWGAYMERRQQLKTVEELEARLKADTARLVEFTRSLAPEEFAATTQMPFPGDHRVADNIQYHVWNMAYHEGQIAQLLQQLGIDPMG